MKKYNLIELSKQYHFRVYDQVLLIPATMPTDVICWLIKQGYSTKFSLD